MIRRLLFPRPVATPGGGSAGLPVLLLLATVMLAAIGWQNVAYRGVPDARGFVASDHCAFEVAGFAWFCGGSE